MEKNSHGNCRWKMISFCIGIVLITSGYNAIANITLPKLVGNNMVLQRNINLKIWGWADKGEKITVLFAGQEAETITGKDGKWLIVLSPMNEGGPYEMTIKGKNSLILTNILIGDVWLCSGQSNMEMKLREVNNREYEIENSQFPMIHFLDVGNVSTYSLNDDISSRGWIECNPQTSRSISAVAYFFGRELFKKYKVPIGLIESDWGGSPAEAWISPEGLLPFPEFKSATDKFHITELKHNLPARDQNKEFSTWLEEVNRLDLRLSKGVSYSDVSCNTKDWSKMSLPGLWEKKGLPDYDGIVWFRKEIEISKEQAGKDLTLNLVSIDDIDNTWFNGVNVGNTKVYNLKRRYVVPGNLVKEGKNTIVVRVIDSGYGGGFSGDSADFKASSGNDIITLTGEWLYKPTIALKDIPELPKLEMPATFYNGMIYPLHNYAIKGAIWYQGESNADKAIQYRKLFPALIADWRKNWGIGDFPFIFVQLPNWKWGGNWPIIREAQASALCVPNTGMASTIDLGDSLNIHPRNKQEVSRRLALAALKVAYDEKIISSGPGYEAMMLEGNKIRVKFSNTGSGIIARNSEIINNFVIAGEDHVFVPANAYIEDNTILVVSAKVQKPVAVRYAWSANPEGINVYNREGLPLVPFRTDNWDN